MCRKSRCASPRGMPGIVNKLIVNAFLFWLPPRRFLRRLIHNSPEHSCRRNVKHPPPDIDELVPPDTGLTPKAAAERLGVDRSTIYRMIKAGSLVSWRVAATQETRGVPRISSSSVFNYQKLQRIQPHEAESQAPREKSDSKQPVTPAHQAALARLKSLGIA